MNQNQNNRINDFPLNILINKHIIVTNIFYYYLMLLIYNKKEFCNIFSAIYFSE